MTSSRLASLYARALRLYPAGFRSAYAEPMLQSFRDALADESFSRRALLPLVLRDFVISLIKEHLVMLRETYSRPVLMFNALVLAGISTVLALALYIIPQQVLRNGANDPQVEMATNAAARLESTGINDGLSQGVLGSSVGPVNMTRSLSPFLVIYNDQGRVIGSNAHLDMQVPPAPPPGVFEYVRTHGEERITWRPQHGLRIAAVLERVNGPQPAFVLAGRSMREVEANIDHIRNLAALTWLAMLGLIVFGTGIFGWITRKTPMTTAA